MSLDLQALFDEAGYDGPAHEPDCDYIVRRGRRARARRQVLVGGTAVIGAGVVALAGGTLLHDADGAGPTTASGSGNPTASVASLSPAPSDSQPNGIQAALQAVKLPDPAPGFPYRRQPDKVALTQIGRETYWVRSFLLSETPTVTSTDASGNVTHAGPALAQATIQVGTFPIPQPDKVVIGGQTASSHPPVAGVTGTAITQQRDGVGEVDLYFAVGGLNVQIVGTGGATLDQLVALGDALTGLPAPSTSPSATTVPTASPVVTVASAQKVDLGSGSYLTVTTTEKCYVLADPPNPSTPECKSLTDGNQATRSISLQSGSGGAGKPTIMTGIYTGNDARLITVTSGGVTRAATIVKLGAHPSSLVYYLVWPTPVPAGAAAQGGVTIEAFDSAGRSLAKLGG